MSSVSAVLAPLLFGFTLFLGSALLCVLLLIVGRTMLPQLGGYTIAWNATLVFFQAALLTGFAYAALVHRFRGLRWQPVVQIVLMGLVIILCGDGLLGAEKLLELAPRLDEMEVYPLLGTLALLSVAIGTPCVVL